MPTIHVCPLSAVADTAGRTRASHLLTLLGPAADPPPTPSMIAAERHQRLFFHDISEPVEGYEHPTAAHIADILGFTRGWDRRAPLVIHCWAGISRSTAAAYMTACALAPDADEAAIAVALRHASPTATPNILMVRLADARLGRAGRMVAAIAAIGRGAPAHEGEPFALDFAGLVGRRGAEPD